MTALRRPSKNQISVAVLLGVLGFAGVVQVQANNEDDTYTGASPQDLIQLINSQELATQRVDDQISNLESTRDALQSDTAASEVALEVARKQAVSLAILAGTVPVVGRGTEVTIDGPPEAIGTEELVNCIQELRDAGAEAMQLNDAVRLVGASAISDGPGDSVIVDGKQVQPPFVIDAIGNPSGLEKGLTIFQGFQDDIEAAGERCGSGSATGSRSPLCAH